MYCFPCATQPHAIASVCAPGHAGAWEIALHWCHNDHDSVSNHQSYGCLLNRFFGGRSKKTSKLLVTGLCAGNSPGPVNSPHKGPVMRKMFPFDDVIVSKYMDGSLHIQAEYTQIQWKQPLLICCIREDYNIMACRICIDRFWLVDGKGIIPVGFPTFYVVKPPLWMPIIAQEH